MILTTGKIRIKIDFSFAAALTWLILKRPDYWLCFVCAFLHEAGHLCVILFCGEKISEISFLAFGARITRSGTLRLSYNSEIIAALAGPAVNILLCICFALIPNESLKPALYFNAGLAVFILLPIIPLDGGRVLLFALSKSFDADTARKICKKIAVAWLIPLATAGFVVIIKSGYNFTLLAVSVYILFNLLKN